jgi:hypothetical protein
MKTKKSEAQNRAMIHHKDTSSFAKATKDREQKTKILWIELRVLRAFVVIIDRARQRGHQ